MKATIKSNITIYDLAIMMAKGFEDINERMASKEDIKYMATKDDLANFATKDDLANFATKDDLANFATKDDIRRIENILHEHSESLERLEENNILNLQVRVQSLEKSMRKYHRKEK